MATCSRMVQLLRNLNVQLGKLHVSPHGARHIHLTAATTSGATMNSPASVNTSPAHTCCPLSVISGINGHSIILPLSVRGHQENIEINRIEKSRVKYECPKVPGLVKDIETPPAEGTNTLTIGIPEVKPKIEESPLSKRPALQLKQKMRNRRKNQHDTIVRHIKMKRHQLRRVRKKLWPIRRKEKFLRRKKRERMFAAQLEAKKDIGRNFDAVEYVQEWLEKARKAGYRYDYRQIVKSVRNAGQAQQQQKRK